MNGFICPRQRRRIRRRLLVKTGKMRIMIVNGNVRRVHMFMWGGRSDACRTTCVLCAAVARTVGDINCRHVDYSTGEEQSCNRRFCFKIKNNTS